MRLKVDVIVTTGGTPPALVAQQATTTIPIVTTGVGDAVGAGLAANLARPGNITGLTDFVPELTTKRLELLKEAMPRTRRVAVLVNPDNLQRGAPTFKAMESTAGSLKVTLHLKSKYGDRTSSSTLFQRWPRVALTRLLLCRMRSSTPT